VALPAKPSIARTAHQRKFIKKPYDKVCFLNYPSPLSACDLLTRSKRRSLQKSHEIVPLKINTNLQAAIFYLPYKIWHSLEGGLIASFGTDAKTPVMIAADAKYDDGVVMEAVVEKFVKYFKSIFHHNSWYFFYFVCCK
jgi:hypothetical protein